MSRKPPERDVALAVQKLRVHYAKRGRLRFSSHRDFQRALERALRRAEVPMAYSAGFSAASATTGSGVTPSTGGPAGRLAARRRVRLTVAALSSVFSTIWPYSSMTAQCAVTSRGPQGPNKLHGLPAAERSALGRRRAMNLESACQEVLTRAARSGAKGSPISVLPGISGPCASRVTRGGTGGTR